MTRFQPFSFFVSKNRCNSHQVITIDYESDSILVIIPLHPASSLLQSALITRGAVVCQRQKLSRIYGCLEGDTGDPSILIVFEGRYSGLSDRFAGLTMAAAGTLGESSAESGWFRSSFTSLNDLTMQRNW